MTTEKIDNVSITTQANVFFDGKCVSHAITFADGTKKSVGVILPASLTFNTGVPEIMECVAGACEYKLDGSDTWVKSAATVVDSSMRLFTSGRRSWLGFLLHENLVASSQNVCVAGQPR